MISYIVNDLQNFCHQVEIVEGSFLGEALATAIIEVGVTNWLLLKSLSTSREGNVLGFKLPNIFFSKK